MTRELLLSADQRLQAGTTLRGGVGGCHTRRTGCCCQTEATVLLPMAFAGRSEELAWLVGAGRVLDLERYFIIVPDMPGNGGQRVAL